MLTEDWPTERRDRWTLPPSSHLGHARAPQRGLLFHRRRQRPGAGGRWRGRAGRRRLGQPARGGAFRAGVLPDASSRSSSAKRRSGEVLAIRPMARCRTENLRADDKAQRHHHRGHLGAERQPPAWPRSSMSATARSFTSPRAGSPRCPAIIRCYQLWLDGGRVGREPAKRMIVQALGISDQLSPHIVSLSLFARRRNTNLYGRAVRRHVAGAHGAASGGSHQLPERL